MHSGSTTCSAEDFEQALAALESGVPNAAEHRRLTTIMLDTPVAYQLAAMDPFSPEYRRGVLDLYVSLRAKPDGEYIPERDEAPSAPIPTDVWSQLAPWGFRDPAMVGEHLYAWGHILCRLGLPPGGSVLEYGPGSGQLLLMLARMGFRACGVDVDAVALEGIRLQAEGMGLTVPTERALFGEGFGDERFDSIVFYEAFHHALDFQHLLRRLHDRLKPGGHVILCGEPIVAKEFPGIPYPWGPRLDALSVFCMRRFGWMELGFTHTFFVEAARSAGWQTNLHTFPGCGRAQTYVLQPITVSENREKVEVSPQDLSEVANQSSEDVTIDQLRAQLNAVHTSTSWRVTEPLRLVGRLLSLALAIFGHNRIVWSFTGRRRDP